MDSRQEIKMCIRDRIYVTFINDVSVKAEMKKYDGNTGIAVLSVKTSELTESTKNCLLYTSRCV